MNTLFIVIASIVYILALICLAIIVFIPGIGVWMSEGDTGYAIEIPAFLKIICLILLIALLGGGLFLLWRSYVA